MKLQNISKKLLTGVVFTAALVSCSEDKMDEINKDHNHTTAVPAKMILTDVMTSTAFSVVSGDFNLYGGMYVEHETGSHNQFYYAETRSSCTSASTFNNSWGGTYSTLKDALISVKVAEEEQNFITKGIAELFVAYNLAILTDMYGDTPWKEACDYTVSMTPAIDKQEEIYKDIMAYVDAAIEDLQKSDLTSLSNQDLIYKGDASAWLKTAYGLKARYTMRLMGRSADVKGDMEKVLDYISKSYTSAAEQCSYAMYGVGVNINPFFGVFYSRLGEVASRSMFDKLNERNDPRIRRCYVEANSQTMIASKDDPLLNLAHNGDLVQSQLEYTVVAGMANMEVNIKSALASDYWGGFLNVTNEVTPEEAASYFDENVAPLFDANPLKETMIQKYISFWNADGESTECYNDVRRLKSLGEDIYGLQNPGKFPLRCPYGNDDTTTNPNIQAAYGDGQYVFTENVWWAGGTR